MWLVTERRDKWVAERAEIEFERVAIAPSLPEVDAGAGHTTHLHWDAVPGATQAEIISAAASIGPTLTAVNQSLNVKTAGNEREVSIPQGRLLMALHLEGLKRVNSPDEKIPVTNASADRLVISVPDARGEMMPVCAVPSIGRRKLLPPAYTGAAFSNGVVTFDPPLDARKVRIGLTDGTSKPPEEWNALPIELASSVSATLGVLTSDVSMSGPDNATWWAFPGPMPSDAPQVDVDLAAPLAAALKRKLDAKQTLDLDVVLKGAPGCKAGYRFSARGALVRSFTGVRQTTLAGSPRRLDLGESVMKTPLVNERPASVTAELAVHYEGIRVLETVSDVMPAAAGNVRGLIVADQPARRAFPPEALVGQPIARVGLFGRAPVECELSAQFIDASTGPNGPLLGEPGVVRLPPSHRIDGVWIAFPAVVVPSGPIQLVVRATRGRFLWATGANGPLAKIAIRDPNPGNRPVRINGQTLISIAQAETPASPRALPAEAFQGVPPLLDSDLFLTVDLADLTLRYNR